MAGHRDSDSELESHRILDRISRETDPSAPLVVRMAKGAHSHVTAADADSADPIEYWGTRIGRALGLLLTAALLVWLITLIIRN